MRPTYQQRTTAQSNREVPRRDALLQHTCPIPHATPHVRLLSNRSIRVQHMQWTPCPAATLIKCFKESQPLTAILPYYKSPAPSPLLTPPCCTCPASLRATPHTKYRWTRTTLRIPRCTPSATAQSHRLLQTPVQLPLTSQLPQHLPPSILQAPSYALLAPASP